MASWASEPRRAGVVPPLADLDRLDRLDRHQRLGQVGVELAVPVHVAAEADRHAVGQHLGHAAERVTLLGGRLDRGDHGLLGRRVEAAHGALVDLVQVGRVPGRGLSGAVRGVTERHDVAHDRDAEVGQQQLGQRAGRHPGGRLPGRGPLEHVAGVVEAVLEHPGQVGVARPGLGQHLGRARRARATSPRSTSATRCWRSRWPPATPACGRGGCRRARVISSASKRMRGPRP